MPAGRKPTDPATHRQVLNARLPQPVIEALRRAVDENGTTLTDEIEARLVETLIRDGLLARDVAETVCGAFAAASAA
jgi:hypothetical protein